MPDMENLYHKLAEKGFQMVANTAENTSTVNHFLKEQSYPFMILLDPAGTLHQRFEIRAIPTTLVVDNQSRLALRKEGSTPGTPDRGSASFSFS